MSGSKGAATNYYPPDASYGPSRLASTLELGPLLTAVPCARLHAKLILKEWDLADVADDAELIISELMTNALRAARPLPEIQPITLHLQATHEHLMIQVWDALSAAPAPRPHPIDAETGRGLEIVSLLSERWGFYHPAGGGKVIWATLKISATPAPPGKAGA
jgi:anti-sigma regulatory factor (Ser/Thr protein kinase)